MAAGPLCYHKHSDFRTRGWRIGNWTAITLLYKPAADLQSAVGGSRRLWRLGSACGGVRGSIGAACAVWGFSGGRAAGAPRGQGSRPHDEGLRAATVQSRQQLRPCASCSSAFAGIRIRISLAPLAALAACCLLRAASRFPAPPSRLPRACGLGAVSETLRLLHARRHAEREPKKETWTDLEETKVCWHTLRPGAQAQQQGEREQQFKRAWDEEAGESTAPALGRGSV